MNTLTQPRPPKLTARRRIVEALAEEILKNPDNNDHLIASEHQLCRRFSVSRVTIRLALSDLEHRGLIYRQHGRGTFAHGRLTRPYRSIGILIRSPDALKQASTMEVIRGVYAAIAPLRIPLVLISFSPLEWQMENTYKLGGVIVLLQQITPEEITAFQNIELPFLCIQDSLLYAGNSDFFNLGKQAAEALSLAAAAGEIRINLANLDSVRDPDI
jgi:DNA-binding transcriptional regulator YhcF (GntR family)